MCAFGGNNCCTRQNQLQIFKKWVVNGERKKVFNYYKKFHTTYDEIFELFKKVEEQAQLVIENTSENKAGSNCYKIANTIEEFKASEMKEQVLKHVKQTY